MTLEHSVLATLSYSNIFDYPLSFEELHKNLILKKISKERLAKVLDQLIEQKRILKLANFYLLPAREKLVVKRVVRKKYAKKKIKKALQAAKILSIIPTVKLIGISGSLAIGNTPKNDDIDFFIICAQKTLFTTRFFCNLFLDFLNLRRRPTELQVSDKICLNMFLSEKDLGLTPHDLYLAHEVLQMQPVVARGDIYQKFLQQNLWVCKFLPNWQPGGVENGKWRVESLRKKKFSIFAPSPKRLWRVGDNFPLSILENFMRNFQVKYMEKRRTKELISDTKLLFHPHDVHYKVIKDFKKRLKMLNIPLDKNLIYP